ncbi:recombinase family protein [Tolypothrix sp. FACHB-123]|uniref:recombinase family protein n=1 Tax=Tolypothrix sp. FACHB-123 TaxID=2692868 RepID=UPI001683C803|nr:recombinase family protein [Tolypothrix sp. FACHB-123]MBD2359365.1 recombinase family protein [Tolypothrix sp. FACHB-123]
MKLVGYVRVSSESQAENTSLTEQRQKIESYCYAFGHELLQIFEEVGSGKNTTHRPQFQSALKLVSEQADGIIAAKLDRLARNTRDVLALVDDVLQPQRKALILLDLQVDTTTPQGYMILTVMSAVAKLERDIINERTQGGRRAKADNGGYAYGAPAFGQKAVDGELIPDLEELDAIEAIRKHHKSGKSFGAISQWMNMNGYKTKLGRQWHPNSVKRVVDRLYHKT